MLLVANVPTTRVALHLFVSSSDCLLQPNLKFDQHSFFLPSVAFVHVNLMCTDTQPWVLASDSGLPVGGAYVVFLGVLYWLLICAGIHAFFIHNKIAKPSAADSFLKRLAKSREFWYRVVFLVICFAWGLPLMLTACRRCDGGPDMCDNWVVLWVYGVFFIVTSNVASRPLDFYLGEGLTLHMMFNFYFRGKEPPTVEEIEAAAMEKRRLDSGTADYQVGFRTLMPSVFVAWVFAKSIQNAADLGGQYGMLGGLAYSGWYISFVSVSVVCYVLRTRFGFKSLSSAIFTNYGIPGCLCYQFAVMFRCWSEVWSNATVIGAFFGSAGSSSYWGAAWLSSLIPCTYAVMGGMRASLISDVVQAGVGISFLLIVLITIGADKSFMNDAGNTFIWHPITTYKTGNWAGGWWACFVGGLIQGICSYPFFDPILTDRAFLSSPKSMLASFLVGGFVAAWFIFFYAAIGVYGAYYHELYATMCGCGSKNPIVQSNFPSCPWDKNPCSFWNSSAGAPQYAAYILGQNTYTAVQIFITVTMITASMASVDSAFTCWAKLVSLDFGGFVKLKGDNRTEIAPLKPHDALNIGNTHMLLARLAAIPLLITGVSYLGIDKNAMSATSAAGTMVMGIGAPIWFMCLWRNKEDGKRGFTQAPLAFVAPFAAGVAFGVIYYQDGLVGHGLTYDNFILGDKSYSYSRFLGVNLWGHLICLAFFLFGFAYHQLCPRLWFWKLEQVESLIVPSIVSEEVQFQSVEAKEVSTISQKVADDDIAI